MYLILHLSVALNILYILLSSAEPQDRNTKQPSTSTWRKFWVPSSCKCRRADYLPTQFPAQYGILTAFCSCKPVTLQGCYALSCSLFSFKFPTR